MSEQVRRFMAPTNDTCDMDSYQQVVLATDYDALHAEAEALRAENAKLRTALAEQGERQEAVAVKSHGAWDGLDDLDNLPDGTMLFTATQPVPDVRGLTMRDVMQALESVPGAPALSSNMCHAIAQQLNAHRQAQRQA